LKKLFTLFVLSCLFSTGLIAQENDETSSDTTDTEEPTRFKDPVEHTPPTIAIGVGTISYFGELNNSNTVNSPLISRLAFDLSFRQPVTHFLEFSLNAWGGKISANERSLTRNLNFETTLYGGGFGFNYNFGNFLKPERTLEPVIGVGIEFISFNAKTDLMSENNVNYHYWDDGTIRNLPQTAANSDDAVKISRDYYYETDIKNSPLYDLDSYDSYTLAFPVMVGANLLVNDNWTFRAAMTYHFTMTDLLDGIDQSSGAFVGDAKMDDLLYTSVSISYNFTKQDKFEDAMDDFIDIDMMADEDEDGVIDWDDLCLGTPFGAEVDGNGCPLDGDKDGVPNYGDDEFDSAPGANVDSSGVTITTADVNLFYEKYFDTTGTHSPITAETYSMQVIASKVKRKSNVNAPKYSVAIGEFEGEIPADLVNDILSVQDVNTHDKDGKILVTVGSYPTKEEAELRQEQLVKDGITPTDIVKIDSKKAVSTVTGVTPEFAAEQWEGDENSTEIIYRVQVGAFTQKADEKIFKDLPELIQVNSDDGYVRYFTGSFDTYQKAASSKIDILSKGFKGSFVVAFRGGHRVALNNLGVVNLNKSQTSGITSTTPLTNDQKENLKFKVQLGSYRSQIPTDVLETYMELGTVEQMKGKDKYIRYVAGSFSSYEEATTYKNELLTKGFKGCYVVGVYYGKMISASQGRKMLNK
jgi:cell division protein FtsN